MTHTACARAWEAGAIEDGRLDALGAASFERHMANCDECTREATELREIREALGRLEPRDLSVLEQRRQRTELLRRANARIVTRRESPRVPRKIAGVVALAATVALLLGVTFAWRRHASLAARSAEPVFELRAIDGASFHDETSGLHGRVVLSSGSLAVHVEHLRPLQTFVVGVPDGELEVRGTRFIVEVGRGHTERVLVTEGVVAVRLTGSPERRLAAGESWTRPSSRALDGSVLVDAVNDTESGRGTARVSEPDVDAHRPGMVAIGGRSPRASAERDAVAVDGRLTTLVRRHHVGNASTDQGRTVGSTWTGDSEPKAEPRAAAPSEFAAAMAAFDTGAYLDADERFSAFAARFPSDARGEDAAFLRAVIAVKRGDSTAAVARARDYLRRFPGGLRRAEMARLVDAPL